MDQLTMAMQHSSLSKKMTAWVLNKILRSFPMEICHMIAERLEPPTTQPVDSTISHMRLKASMSGLTGRNIPIELQNTFRKAYYRNTTFRLQAHCLRRRSIQSTLRTFLAGIGDNINDLTTLRIEHYNFLVVFDIIRTKNSISIVGTLQNRWFKNNDNGGLFEYIARHMLAAASTPVAWRLEGRPPGEITRNLLERVVKTFCKLEIARHMISRSWLFRNEEDGLDPSVLPGDELLQEYVDYDKSLLKPSLAIDSKDPWIFE